MCSFGGARRSEWVMDSGASEEVGGLDVYDVTEYGPQGATQAVGRL